jgi:hypothetical protein
LSERNFDADGHIRGWLWKGDDVEELHLKRHGDYFITDMAMMAGGKAFITVERSLSPPSPPGMALRLFDLPPAPTDTLLEGELLLEARQPI